jgi:hypothetical protein
LECQIEEGEKEPMMAPSTKRLLWTMLIGSVITSVITRFLGMQGVGEQYGALKSFIHDVSFMVFGSAVVISWLWDDLS